MTYLPDVNVWIALAAERHRHHLAARRWFAGLRGDETVFCRLTQLGFLRLLTNSHVMQDEVLTPEQAWSAYELLRSNLHVGYVNEPRELGEVWRAFAPNQFKSQNLWTDAYLCAFCHAAKFSLVTFDTKLPARTGLAIIVLDGSRVE